MNKAKELLMECKIKLKIQSDYALAKELKINRARMCEYMLEKRVPDAYAAFKIAICLNKDPARVLAEIEADTEKNKDKKEFWQDFLARAKQATLWGTLALVFTLSLLGGVKNSVEGVAFFRRKFCA